jgi:hypothetical protein
MSMTKNFKTNIEAYVKVIILIIYVFNSLYLIYRVRICLSDCTDKRFLAINISVCFVGMTVPISFYHCWEHLNYFVKPKLQSQIVRIIWMVRL